VNWRVFELVKGFIIKRVGRGLFALGKESTYFGFADDYTKDVGLYLKDCFPYAEFCVWNSAAINEFAQHLIGHSFILVDAERDVAEAIYYKLKDRFKPVFHTKGNIGIEDLLPDFDNPIVVRNLISESPIINNQMGHTASLEKILVDIFCDQEFSFLQGAELFTIYKNAFDKYTVNRTKLLRYVSRKGKKEELQQILGQL
jgi:hypothetical protein